MENLIKYHYELITHRGLITPDTTIQEFIDKITEEYTELLESFDGEDFSKQEAVDLVMVCLHLLRHQGVDIEDQIKKNIKIQERRIYIASK